jgi:soluble lytic murein transglycosylase
MAALADVEAQRATFLKAEKTLQRGQTAEYSKLYRQLHDYPLQPYLELADLKKRLGKAKHSEIRSFLNRHKGTPVGDSLRRTWLNRLARNKAWQSYLDFYAPQSSISRQCHRLTALIETGKQQQAWRQVEKVWLHGKSRPAACDAPFKAWEEAGKRSDALTWQRIELALEKGQWRLARYLGKKLGNQDTVWLQRWLRIHRNPRDILRHQDYTQQHPYREKMLAHTVRRMASFDGMEALELWEQVESRYPFSRQQRYEVERRLALALERSPEERAHRLIMKLKPRADDDRLYTARLRAALLRGDWSQLLKDIPNWPQKERNSERGRYWLARAQEASGQHVAAQEAFRQLAQLRSYYGFLAADRIGASYHLLHADTPVSPAERLAMQRKPGIQRALELHALERDIQARREWQYATRNATPKQLKAAATLAEASNWHDQAIFTLAKTGYWDDLELRFPLSHLELVEQLAQQHDLDIAWIFAVIRQESAFMRDARSHAGAMGLMQLMPATARSVAKKQLGKKRAPRKQALLKPDTNIELGSAYLKHLLQRLENSPVLATAAYNAGPHRVDKWLPPHDLDADIWVDLVPFNETRRYLRSVLSYMVIYDKRLGRQPKRLRERMAPIAAATSKLAGA